MLTYADVCWWDKSLAKMMKLTYADVWRMLTCADLCRLHVAGQAMMVKRLRSFFFPTLSHYDCGSDKKKDR